MSGLGGATKNTISYMTKPQNIDKVMKKFTHPNPRGPMRRKNSRVLDFISIAPTTPRIYPIPGQARPDAAEGATREGTCFQMAGGEPGQTGVHQEIHKKKRIAR